MSPVISSISGVEYYGSGVSNARMLSDRVVELEKELDELVELNNNRLQVIERLKDEVAKRDEVIDGLVKKIEYQSGKIVEQHNLIADLCNGKDTLKEILERRNYSLNNMGKLLNKLRLIIASKDTYIDKLKSNKNSKKFTIKKKNKTNVKDVLEADTEPVTNPSNEMLANDDYKNYKKSSYVVKPKKTSKKKS